MVEPGLGTTPRRIQPAAFGHELQAPHRLVRQSRLEGRPVRPAVVVDALADELDVEGSRLPAVLHVHKGPPELRRPHAPQLIPQLAEDRRVLAPRQARRLVAVVVVREWSFRRPQPIHNKLPQLLGPVVLVGRRRRVRRRRLEHVAPVLALRRVEDGVPALHVGSTSDRLGSRREERRQSGRLLSDLGVIRRVLRHEARPPRIRPRAAQAAAAVGRRVVRPALLKVRGRGVAARQIEERQHRRNARVEVEQLAQPRRDDGRRAAPQRADAAAPVVGVEGQGLGHERRRRQRRRAVPPRRDAVDNRHELRVALRRPRPRFRARVGPGHQVLARVRGRRHQPVVESPRELLGRPVPGPVVVDARHRRPDAMVRVAAEHDAVAVRRVDRVPGLELGLGPARAVQCFRECLLRRVERDVDARARPREDPLPFHPIKGLAPLRRRGRGRRAERVRERTI